jgi:hypothetical protein
LLSSSVNPQFFIIGLPNASTIHPLPGIMDKVDKQSFEHDDNIIDPKEESMAHDGYVPGTEEEKKLVRKIDLFILPMMWLMYLLSYMDRTKLVYPLAHTR